MKTIDELDRLHANATAGEWTAAPDRNAQPNLYARDTDGFEHWIAILPHQCLASLEALANANAASIAALHNAWPEVSARLRAAEAEVKRLQGALRGAIEELDTIPEDPKRFARVAGMTIPLVRGGLSRALLPAEARAALGEP